MTASKPTEIRECAHDFDSNEESEYCAFGCGERLSYFTIKNNIAEITKLRKQVKDYEQALEFECGNRCAEQNPCNAREALKKWGAVRS